MIRFVGASPPEFCSDGIEDVVIPSLSADAFFVSPNTGMLNPVMLTALHPESASPTRIAPAADSIRITVRLVVWCCIARIDNALFYLPPLKCPRCKQALKLSATRTTMVHNCGGFCLMIGPNGGITKDQVFFLTRPLTSGTNLTGNRSVCVNPLSVLSS